MRVFLSYHTPERAIALALKSAIENALPAADVFVDQTHLRHGHLWQPALFEAIAKAQAFCVLVSNRLGDWQKVEYYEARDRKAKDDGFILLPIIVADPAKGPVANLPGLSQLHWIESTEPAAPEPLAKILAALQFREVPKQLEAWRTVNPYRGLIALEEQDADFFFGRDRETGDIINQIIARPGRLIALVGNSGVGKSSLVQAGVIGALKRQRWPDRPTWPETLKGSRGWAYLTMKPGEDPIGSLVSEFTALWYPDATDPSRIARRNEWSKLLLDGEAGLADLIETTDTRFRNELSLSPPSRVFLYIDQGEELYARTPPTERKRFSTIVARGLVQSAQRLTVMTSQRADYYGELQANAPLFKLTDKIDVAPLDVDGLALVLREPARVLGVGFESDELIGHIVKSAEDQPGALPLLADLFTDLWEHMRERGDGILRVSDRHEIIQVGAALAKRADQFLSKHPDKVEAVKRLFALHLTHVPRQGEPVRVRWERDRRGGTSQDSDAELALVELLAGPDWRLLVTGEKDGKATAEVAHEILLKTWPALRRWLENEREFLVWRGELEARREEYDKAGMAGAGQQRQALLMGLPLDTAEKWLKERRADIDPAARAFIEASKTADRAVARNRQRLQAAVGLLLVFIIAGLVAFINQAFLNEQWFKLAYMRGHAPKPEQVRALTRGQVFRECAKAPGRDGDVPRFAEYSIYCPEMVVVPAGTFLMGAKGQQHEVVIAKAFAVSKFEVTAEQWHTCVIYGGCAPGGGIGKEPANGMSWHDAQHYVAWMSKHTGHTYRLLSEAEWEHAARAGSTTNYSWGDDIGIGNANCNGCGSDWDDKRAAPVGSFKPNAFGLYDMLGNVWEWVEDPWHQDYNGAPRDGTVWTKGGDDSRRVVRGGSWFNFPDFLRSADRFRNSTGLRDDSVGFRVARTITP